MDRSDDATVAERFAEAFRSLADQEPDISLVEHHAAHAAAVMLELGEPEAAAAIGHLLKRAYPQAVFPESIPLPIVVEERG